MTKTKTKARTFKTLVVDQLARKRNRGERPKPINQLAQDCGVSRAFFYFMMQGTRSPSEAIRERIADVLGVSDTVVSRALAASVEEAVREGRV